MENQSRKRQQRTEAQEWCFRLVNDPEYFEKWIYTDTINDYSNLIGVSKAICANTYNKSPHTC